MQRPTILYIEDYDLVLFTVKQLFEQEGWCVDVCRDGVAGMSRLEGSNDFDLIIVDAQLPGISGLELLRRARVLEHRRQTPIIIFTATDCREEASAAEADAYMVKPGGMRDLVAVCKRLLQPKGNDQGSREVAPDPNLFPTRGGYAGSNRDVT